ncbi:hypothetical protein, partial [uncultured Draconibacterium sp.]|uniref:hypothetical protein n=1 Tax=uncultured Draconibacterium sp. TaxID=1573823 RepID=UPI0026330AE4
RNNRGTNKKGGRNFENKSNTPQNKQNASEAGDKNKRPNKRRNNNPNRKRKPGFQAKKAQPASGNNNSN